MEAVKKVETPDLGVLTLMKSTAEYFNQCQLLLPRPSTSHIYIYKEISTEHANFTNRS
jgi:hypothetical protein